MRVASDAYRPEGRNQQAGDPDRQGCGREENPRPADQEAHMEEKIEKKPCGSRPVPAAGGEFPA